MSLDNLLKIGRIQRHDATPGEITRLILAARRSLDDARLKSISPEGRFDLAYKSVMQCAHAALMANGYRPSTSEPGHHATVIQALPITVGLSGERMMILDKLRKKRNLNDYFGQDVGEEEVAACIRSAEALAKTLGQWLRAHRPDLALGDSLD